MLTEGISPRHSEGTGNFKIGQVNCIVQYTDGTVLLAKKECYGIEMNVKKN